MDRPAWFHAPSARSVFTTVLVLGGAAVIVASMWLWDRPVTAPRTAALRATRGNLITVPDVVGMKWTSATLKLQDDGFEVTELTEGSSGAPSGQITKQIPDPDSREPDGGTVVIYTSLGPPVATTTTSTVAPGISLSSSTGLATCATASLFISVSLRGAAANDDAVVVAFENVGRVPCVMSGYPSVTPTGSNDPTDATGVVEEQPSGYDGGYLASPKPLPVIEVAPDHSVSSVVQTGDSDTQGKPCAGQYTALEVAPPGSAQRVQAPVFVDHVTLPDCSAVDVSPVVPGVTFRYPN